VPELTIRATEPRDISDITRIYAYSVTHGTATFELEPPSMAEMLRRFDALREGSYPFLTAHFAGAVIGYAYAGPYRSRPAYRYTVEDSVYLAPEMQGRGFGRVLLERLLTEAERRGFRQMVAVIGDSAQAPSIRLHAALGFRLVGTFEAVGFKFDSWLDTVLMQKRLGMGAESAP
jgi:L-amino acid N-acyltransferase YncA